LPNFPKLLQTFRRETGRTGSCTGYGSTRGKYGVEQEEAEKREGRRERERECVCVCVFVGANKMEEWVWGYGILVAKQYLTHNTTYPPICVCVQHGEKNTVLFSFVFFLSFFVRLVLCVHFHHALIRN
jgi:hypothetical protein